MKISIAIGLWTKSKKAMTLLEQRISLETSESSEITSSAKGCQCRRLATDVRYWHFGQAHEGLWRQMLNRISSTGNLTYARIPDNDVVLLMGNNIDMQTDFEKGDTFDIQRPHFDANFIFDVIPQEIEAVLTAIVALTECSKTWFLCKGTPQEIIKAATGGALTNMKEILNILQLLHQVAND